MGIVEILVVLIVALIVIPPENLPEVARALGKIMRELRLASNTVMRELGSAIEEPGQTIAPRQTIAPPPAEPNAGADKPSAPAEPR